MNRLKYEILLLIISLFFLSCETEFVPEDSDQEPEIVVEGYIEAGEDAAPPFVILTQSVSFFSEFDPEAIDGLFVHDALVEVDDGSQIHQLNEFCVNDIPEPLRPAILNLLGFDIDPEMEFPNICAYVDTTGQLMGQVGGRYDLRIEVEGKVLTASTTIPGAVPIYDLHFIQPTEFSPDTLRELRASIDDPAGQIDFYRYFTAINQSPFQAPFQSVADDAFFDGQTFEFPLAKAESRTDPPGIDEFGLFAVGDTARIKWCTLDETHYNFWLTLEFNAISQGPFSSYTIVDSNIEGGIGIWGGYAVGVYEAVVE